MRKHVLLGAVLALSALFMLSCSKNHYDLDQVQSVEGSGQWKLPIGSVHTTLGKVLNQFGENDLISYDANGNLQIQYSFRIDDIIKGSNFLTLGTLNFTSEINFVNPFPGMHLPVAIDTVLRFQQIIELDADSATIESAVIKTCTMVSTIQGNLGEISRMEISSSDITMPNGDSLYTTEDVVDLAGASFRLHDANGVADSVMVINYAIFYQLEGIDDPEYHVNLIMGLNNLKLQELSGHIDHFVYDFTLDTTFSLPIGNVEGQLDLVGATLTIQEKNTFENLYALLNINQAELYGGSVAPSMLFNNYPYQITVVPSNTFEPLDPVDVNVSVCSDYNAIRLQGEVDFNPLGSDRLIVIHDTSSLSLGIDAMIPMQFNVPGVYYIDTLDLNMGDITVPSLIEKLVLGIMFNSQMPFNFTVQLYPLNSMTGAAGSPLLDEELLVNGSFDGNPVMSEGSITLTNQKLQELLDADKLIMRIGVNTGNHDVILNLDNGLEMTLKADVYYGGSVDLNN